jgi:hypothetical protein
MNVLAWSGIPLIIYLNLVYGSKKVADTTVCLLPHIAHSLMLQKRVERQALPSQWDLSDFGQNERQFSWAPRPYGSYGIDGSCFFQGHLLFLLND